MLEMALRAIIMGFQDDKTIVAVPSAALSDISEEDKKIITKLILVLKIVPKAVTNQVMVCSY